MSQFGTQVGAVPREDSRGTAAKRTEATPPLSAAQRGRIAAERWLREGWLQGHAEIALEVFTPGVKGHADLGETVGIAAIQAGAVALPRALEDMQASLEIIGEGEDFVAIYRLLGRHVGPLFGAPPTGTLLELAGTVTLHTEDGRIAESWQTCANSYLAAPLPSRARPRGWVDGR